MRPGQSKTAKTCVDRRARGGYTTGGVSTPAAGADTPPGGVSAAVLGRIQNFQISNFGLGACFFRFFTVRGLRIYGFIYAQVDQPS